MAFTNYLLQTVVRTAIFHGHGLGLFGSVERAVQLLITLAIGLWQLWLSPIWLRSFVPFEWAWRALTYARMELPRFRGH